MTRLSLILPLSLLLAAPLAAGPVFDVKNDKGVALSIELLEVDGDMVTFSTTGVGAKEHSMKLDTFDEASRATILREARDLKPRPPKLDITVSVSKKRKKTGYYMVEQTVSTKVGIRNLGVREVPKSKAHMTYFGRDRRNADNYKIMARKTFDCQIASRGRFETEVPGFKTSFDSDKKGYGNIGGYQYDGYLLVIMDDDENVLAYKTSDPALRASIEQEPAKARRVTMTALNKVLDKTLEELE